MPDTRELQEQAKPACLCTDFQISPIRRIVAEAAAQEEQTPKEKVEKIQEESSGKLEEALDGVEENLDAQVCLSHKPQNAIITLGKGLPVL